MRGELRVPVARVEAGESILDEDASRYVARVHRKRLGDRIVLFDPDRVLEASAVITAMDRQSVAVMVEDVREGSLRPRQRVTLLQATCKSDKLDAIVRDATELGVTRIVPVLAERSVGRPAEGRARRWRKIAVEAARQCGRGDAPAIASPMELSEAVSLFASGEGVVGFCLDPWAPVHLAERLRSVPLDVELAFLIGPEGGFSPSEVEACASAGLVPVTLGPLTLRAETVGTAVLGAVMVRAGGFWGV